MTQILCKTTLNEVMPAVRAAVSIQLSKMGLTQMEVSKRLGITQPAISQYKKRVRGEMLELLNNNSMMDAYIAELAEHIVKDNVDLNSKTCKVCEMVRSSGLIQTDGKEFLCLADIKRSK